jgi:hypothetical protein
MRASHLAFVIACLALPSSAAYSQDSGLVDGRVGADANASPMAPSTSPGSTGPYHRPPEPGPRAGSSGMIMPGQVVPNNVPVFIRQDGSGSAMVNGHPVIVGPNSSRIVRVIR